MAEGSGSKRIGVYPGTFDPVTNGHMDIIKRACLLADRLIIAVSTNAGKGPLLTINERMSLMRDEIVDPRNGLDPTKVEVLHTWDDFSVRTIGFRGFTALGACFGRLITLVSPGGSFDNADSLAADIAKTIGGNLFGAIKFYKEARGKGVKPLIGAEIAMEGLGKDPGVLSRMILLVQGSQGYLNLSELLARAWTRNVVKAQAVVKLSLAQRNFSTLAAILGRQGYESEFIYGGESHFDNMRGFLVGNGVDRFVDLGVFSDLPKVQAWRRALAARPSVRGAVVADYEARLEAFLRRQKSWLAGRIG